MQVGFVKASAHSSPVHYSVGPASQGGKTGMWPHPATAGKIPLRTSVVHLEMGQDILELRALPF